MTERKPTKREKELLQHIDDLTADVKRVQADFENYRKRVEIEKVAARDSGQSSAVMKLLPVVDTIDRAIRYAPEDLKGHAWVQGVAGLTKQLDSSLEGLNVERIDAAPGTEFKPDLHEAIQFDEEATGEKEVIADELQAGYTMSGRVIRHAMVKVTRE